MQRLHRGQRANAESSVRVSSRRRCTRSVMGATGARTTAVMGVALVVVILAVLEVSAKPTIYVKNADDKLEPVLVPVSSTVIPLPVYKVGFSLGATKGSDKERHGSKPDEPIKLITVHHKKKATGTVPKEQVRIYAGGN